MNIQELYEHNLQESAKFKDSLIPTIWDRHENLTNAVRDQIMIGAEEYCSYLGLNETQVCDILVAGRSAGYEYSLNETIDVVVVANLNPDPTFREFFNENKYRYNRQHPVKIGEHYVKFYVQPSEEPVVSRGAYSVLRESWVQVPVRRDILANDTVVMLSEAERKAQPINKSVAKKKKIVESRKPVVYGYGPDEIVKEDAGLTPTGVSSMTKMFLSEEPRTAEEVLQDFIEFCSDRLGLENVPRFKVKRDPEWSKRNRTFGRFNSATGVLEVSIANRHLMDVCRTVAHELVHQRQAEIAPMPPGAGETGSDHENEANAQAGILMRDYGQANPELFTGDEELSEGASGYIPTKKQAHDPRYEMALTVDVKPGTLGRAANAFKLNTDSQGVPQIANPNGTVKRMNESSNKKSIGWRFKPCTQTSIELSSTLQKSYQDIYEQTGNKWYPHRCSHLAQYIIGSQKNKLNESEPLSGLQKFQQSLKKYDLRSEVEVETGKSVAIIQVIPHIYDNVIELQGFKTPKKIKSVFKDNADNIEYIEFIDGSTYPDQHFIAAGKGGGELEGTSTLFFPNKRSADHSELLIKLKIPGDWSMSNINLK